MQTIKLKVKGEAELFNSLDPDCEQLRDEVKEYIFEKLKAQKAMTGHELVILSEEDIKEERVRAALDHWADLEEETAMNLRRINMLQQIYLFSLGLLFILISLALQSRVGAVFFTVLSSIGGFSTWEAANIWIVENPKLQIKKRIVRKLRAELALKVMRV